MTIYKPCDIRGLYGDELTEEHAYALGHAIAFRQGPIDVIVGGDARTSTPTLRGRVIDGLLEGGCGVINLGMVSTPMFYFALEKLGIQSGVMVTASHNPAHYNGFKIILGEFPVTEIEMHDIQELMESNARAHARQGKIAMHGILNDYLKFARSLVSIYKDMRVVIDYGNGVGALAGPKLWRTSNCESLSLFEDIDGTFPKRSPNPAVANNISALCEAVVENHADLGVAYDGDADRVAFVDDNGNIVGGDKVIVLYVRDILRKQPSTIVYDQKCSRIVPEAIRKAGGKPIVEKSGHTFIKTSFIKHSAAYAGELSGHHFFQSLPQGDDAVIASIFMAGIVYHSGKRLSDLVKDIPSYPITPDIRIPVEPGEAAIIITKLSEALGNEANITFVDGIRAEFPDGWGLARPSVTEPAITLRFEGDNEVALQRIIKCFGEAYTKLYNHLSAYYVLLISEK